MFSEVTKIPINQNIKEKLIYLSELDQRSLSELVNRVLRLYYPVALEGSTGPLGKLGKINNF